MKTVQDMFEGEPNYTGEQGRHHWNIVIVLSDGRTVGWQQMCSTLDLVTEEIREFTANPCNIIGRAKIAKIYAGSETHRLMQFPVK